MPTFFSGEKKGGWVFGLDQGGSPPIASAGLTRPPTGLHHPSNPVRRKGKGAFEILFSQPRQGRQLPGWRPWRAWLLGAHPRTWGFASSSIANGGGSGPTADRRLTGSGKRKALRPSEGKGHAYLFLG